MARFADARQGVGRGVWNDIEVPVGEDRAAGRFHVGCHGTRLRLYEVGSWVALPERIPGGQVDPVVDVQFFTSATDRARPDVGSIRTMPVMHDK